MPVAVAMLNPRRKYRPNFAAAVSLRRDFNHLYTPSLSAHVRYYNGFVISLPFARLLSKYRSRILPFLGVGSNLLTTDERLIGGGVASGRLECWITSVGTVQLVENLDE